MAANHTECAHFDASPADLQRAAHAALVETGILSPWWSPDGRVASGTTDVNLASWGESITVTLLDGGDVQVRSECAMPTQLVDWGRNAKNCRAVLDRLGANLQGSVATAPAADWYPDPTGRHESRYWDGAVWTEHVSDSGRTSADPMPG